MDKLLKCPFCSGEAIVIEEWVACSNCDCMTANYGDIDLAIKAWNTRTVAK